MAKVMIDIGHGGKDPGALGNGLVEKDVNLKVGLMLRDYLSKYDVEVMVTRESDISLSDDYRVGIVLAFNPNLCVSVHHNSAENAAARGAEVIHGHYDASDDKLAEKILANLEAAGMPKRRAFTKLNSRGQDWYYMIRRIWDTNRSAIIVEGGFISNPDDAEMLKKEEYLRQEAAAIGSAIVEHLGLKPKQKNWWEDAMKRMKDEGLILNEHHGQEVVTWGEFATVVTRILDKFESKQ